MDAGADFVTTGLVLNADRIKPELRRFLRVPVIVEEAAPTQSSFGAWLRSYLRLKNA